ncbi:MAG TPA: M64 family metallopeptidase, partial [Acidobacteriota bacterium]|nr:M64 family metallopeptidase [Acidobacteriota bacterium]
MNVRRQKVEQRNDPFLYRVISDDGEILFENTFRDPRTQFFDEPDETGLLHGGVIRNNAGITSLTIPFHKKAMRVDFFQRQQQSSENNLLHSTSLKQFGSIPVGDIQMSMQTKALSERVPPVKIQKTGKPQNRIDMLFLAEGFTAEQRNFFLETVRDIVANWKRFSPWSEYFRLLNIYAVPLVSQDEGADHPSAGIFKDTAL